MCAYMHLHMQTSYTVLSLQFTELDYDIQEPGQTLLVQIKAVRIDGTSIDVGNPVTIRVTPLTYSEFEDRDIQLPPGFQQNLQQDWMTLLKVAPY